LKPSHLLATVVLAVAALAAAAPPVEAAATAAAPSGEVARRIQQELDREAAHERLWWNGWMAVNGGLTVGQGVAAGLSGDRDDRVDLGTDAATSFLGVVGIWISRLPEVDAAAKALRALPSDDDKERRARDEAAVLLRDQAASAEREERSWVAHALNFAVAAGSSLVLWKGFDRDASAAANFPISLAVGELQIWTQPAGLLDGPDAPGQRTAPEGSDPARASLRLAWTGRLLQVVLAF
jgi:hypothetical protein